MLLFVTVSVGTFEQALRGYVSLRLSLALLIGSSVGSQLGALSTNVLPNRVLRIAFAALVLATISLILVDLRHVTR
ncbi:MAG: TSUP family transporter [Polyangiaceae bacterium]